MNTESMRIGEVIEAGSTSFSAQSYELWELPALGSLVKSEDSALELYGVVCRATTQGPEPGRRAIARGKDAPNAEAVFQTNPQLTRLLKSEFAALVVGFKKGASYCRYLPPHPARIHAFVHTCTPAEVQEFSANLDFLGLILRSETDIPTEELAAAVLREMAAVQPDRNAFLGQAGRELARLLSKDYGRLKAIIERIKPQRIEPPILRHQGI